jgi:DNA-binding NarL/FixJ family response regulator
VYRECLAGALNRQDGFTVVGQTSCDMSAVARAQELRPDVMVLDTACPSFVEVARTARSQTLPTRLVALALRETEILACMQAGIPGCVEAGGSLADLVNVIADVLRGQVRYVGPGMARLFRRMEVQSNDQLSRESGVSMTPRELEILRLVGAHLSNKEIAIRLGIELATAKNHVHSILTKLKVHRRWEAAAQLGLGLNVLMRRASDQVNPETRTSG